MKSLEIANKIQNDFNECFSRYDVSTMTIQKPDFYAKEWEQIKQDLEVLEIIKNKKVDFVHLNNYLFLYDKNEEILEKYNKHCFYHNELTLEELLKLKQWLEEHENE